MSELLSLRIGFVGAGQMATALAGGLVGSASAKAEWISACDVHPETLERFCKRTGAVSGTTESVCEFADVVVLATKPLHIPQVLQDLRPHVRKDHLIISIAAGVTLRTLADGLPDGTRLVRVMPNTPSLVGCGAAAFARGDGATERDAEIVSALLSTVGTAHEVDESLLDAVTGLSGSGPAFVYLVVEALSDGGVRAGLPRALATQLAAQTVCGAARMVLETEQHPAVLKDAVASPGGTTIAGLHALETAGVRGAFMNAVVTATARSRELSGK